jgi:hypothetical protein
MNAALDAVFLVSYAMRFAFCSGVSLYSCLGAAVRDLVLLFSVCAGIVCLCLVFTVSPYLGEIYFNFFFK